MEFKLGDSNATRIVDIVLEAALRERASDIHIEPLEQEARIRFRIDGLLRDYASIPLQRHSSIVAKLKIMGSMDIGEQRIPQDGRWQVTKLNKKIDLRLSSLPGLYGEKIVIRILDREQQLLDLEQLSFNFINEKAYRSLYSQPNGLVLVSGPTGSGKSTTLYATLKKLNSNNINITTLEDPVEYTIAGITQVAVNEKAGLTFENGLRAILRQDPDIIMVGEIRDRITAEMAVQAALTGHLVFSTLHTNSAVGTVSRLLDMSVAPYLLAAALRGVLAQRLVRKSCSYCKELRNPNLLETEIFKKYRINPPKKIVHNKGCQNCGYTGYKGRIALQEIFVLSDITRRLLMDGAGEKELLDSQSTLGLVSIAKDGLEKVLEGETTVEELLRVSVLKEEFNVL